MVDLQRDQIDEAANGADIEMGIHEAFGQWCGYGFYVVTSLPPATGVLRSEVAC